MVSLIKNQILKHLSRYTKNLSPDKINLSTLKGEGELTALELDEIVLTDLLELPSWVKLRSATCNKVSFRIQWTKLRSVPIFISLDEVLVDLETCEELNSSSVQKELSSFANATKYGYINKVIDGITITVNAVCISFYSPAFTATVQIMKIVVESKSPEWKKVDLERTRIKDKDRNQVLIFKELEWQDLRFQAKSINDKKLPPLLLLTNKSRCRITIKKRISDCFVMGCKLLLILDDLLWVLTDSQLKAVLHFIESLSDLVQRATESTRKKKAARKLEVVPSYQAQISHDNRDLTDPNNMSAFSFFDVVETSYHFWAQKIDLHLSDDPGDGRSCHRNLKNGGAVHLLFYDLQVDCYPYHLAASERSHWARYNYGKSRHFQWLSDAHISFKNSLFDLLKANENNLTQNTNINNESVNPGTEENESTSNYKSVKNYVKEQMAKVMTSCFVLRIEDLLINRVATTNKLSQKEFIRVLDRSTYPSEDACLHAEFTYYYYPGDIPFPLPPPKFYMVLSPLVVNFDWTTVLWFNSFFLKLKESLNKSNQEESSVNSYFDVKIEAVLPKIIFDTPNELNYAQRDRPKSLHIQATRVMITNVRGTDSSRADLAKCIHSLQLGSLFCATSFPFEPGDYPAVSEKFIEHIQYKDNIRRSAEPLQVSSIDELLGKLSQTMLWIEARDVWCVNLEPLWGDFYGARGIAQNRPVPFLDTFPLKIWFHMNPPSQLESNSNAEINALLHISTLISVQLNHYQFLFLLKLADEFTELSTVISMDTKRIKGGANGSLVLSGIVPQVEVTLVMPSQIAGKESSAADAESVIPDTSSMTDELGTIPSGNQNFANIQDSSSLRFTTIHSPPSMFVETDIADSPNLSENFKTNFNLSSVKKGLSSLIDNALKSTSDEVSKTVSIRSDGSSDSGNFVDKFSGNPGDAMFLVNGNDSFSGGIEVASEVMEDDDNLSGPTISITTNSENPSNTSFYRRKDMIAITTIKLGQVEFIQQSEGLKSAVKAQISNIALEECPTIPWDEFQSKFVSRTRGWNEVCERPADRPRIRLRFNHMVTVSDQECGTCSPNDSWFDDKIIVALSNIDLTVNTSTLSGIGEFVVDDVVSPPLPADITLDNVEFNLIEERLSSMNHSTSVTKVNVASLHVVRSKDGILHIEPIPQPPSSSDITTTTTTSIKPQDSKEYDNLKLENDQLRRRLAAMEKLNEEINHLRKCEEEITVLRSYINESQDKVNTLLNEKQSLLDLVKDLQCSKGDVKYQNSGKR